MMGSREPDGLHMTPAQLKQWLETGEPFELIDVREPFEWSIVNLEPQGARLIPMSELAEQWSGLDRETDIVLYCRSGSRSQRAAQYLREQGFDRVWSLQGGINAWATEVDPALPTY